MNDWYIDRSKNFYDNNFDDLINVLINKASNEINSNEIPVQATEIGIPYNVAANTITSLDSLLPADIVSVNNPNKCTGGTNTETETELLARFKQYINGLQGTNTYGLKSKVLGLPGVRSVSVDEHFPMLDNFYNSSDFINVFSIIFLLLNLIIDINSINKKLNLV